MHEPSEHNIEGLIDNEHFVFTDDNQLASDNIEDEEIIETNKEYSYFQKHYMDKVIKIHLSFFSCQAQLSNLLNN